MLAKQFQGRLCVTCTAPAEFYAGHPESRFGRALSICRVLPKCTHIARSRRRRHHHRVLNRLLAREMGWATDWERGQAQGRDWVSAQELVLHLLAPQSLWHLPDRFSQSVLVFVGRMMLKL